MNDACIEWRGGCSNGYGQAYPEGRKITAHRWAYEKFYGPIPAGLLVLHSCDNPPCINPKHLRVGTRADNQHDMITRRRDWQQKKTHCPKGHLLVPANLVAFDLKRGRRRCLACHRERTRMWHRARKVRS